MKTEKRGGKRLNAGRKKSPYQTKTVSFRVRIELVDDIKRLVKEFLNGKMK